MQIKDEFIKIFTDNIKREGADKLLEWLEKSDFFTAPASTKHHLAVEGGLCQHSINVYKRLEKILIETELEATGNMGDTVLEKAAICGLLHDICKVGLYKIEMRNAKNKETGQWEQVPFYTIDNQLPYGHGEKSVYIISGFMKLTRDESMAINWHMGGFDDRVKGGSYDLSGAFEKYPIALNLHIADMQAAYFDEKAVEDNAQ